MSKVACQPTVEDKLQGKNESETGESRKGNAFNKKAEEKSQELCNRRAPKPRVEIDSAPNSRLGIQRAGMHLEKKKNHSVRGSITVEVSPHIPITEQKFDVVEIQRRRGNVKTIIIN